MATFVVNAFRHVSTVISDCVACLGRSKFSKVDQSTPGVGPKYRSPLKQSVPSPWDPYTFECDLPALYSTYQYTITAALSPQKVGRGTAVVGLYISKNVRFFTEPLHLERSGKEGLVTWIVCLAYGRRRSPFSRSMSISPPRWPEMSNFFGNLGDPCPHHAWQGHRSLTFTSCCPWTPEVAQ